ncbi:MAG TPA: T9SS type A sorting domain-containing protein [Flavobacterium sp.]|uniref:T9SS type A sorting domain-containing protein n=1 Tax=Flavobacterium sp. TaxID=239 RepID=UPI002C65A9A0|nr:T9SS type A sorting domain-containing protein [Flavobacterium sp.]HNP32522.1 T9SS type A sorting domain-containing protein [Flavobacterium sp.]
MKNFYKILLVALLICFTNSIVAQSAGTMTFTFTTPKHTSGNYVSDGRYVLAVWIESCATCGAGTTVGTSTYVRTKLRYWAGGTNDHLPTWNSKSGGSTTNATTGATSTVFTSRTVTWDGMNAAQTALVADGNYRVCVQETWGHGSSTATRYFPFVKGPTSYTNTSDVAADGNLTGISLTWTATLANDTFVAKPQAVIYPNPSSGVFNIEYQNEVKNIKVSNILGEEIYNQKVDLNSENKKQIDLSSFENGVYFISVANDYGSSTYKVVLDK